MHLVHLNLSQYSISAVPAPPRFSLTVPRILSDFTSPANTPLDLAQPMAVTSTA